MALKQHAPARRDYETAVELSPSDGEYRFHFGRVLVELGEHAKSFDHFEMALELKYRPDLVHLNLGIAKQKSGDFDNAIAEFQRAKAAGFPSFLCDRYIAECKRREL
jgi:Tfp pilus assembly protein PilF